MNFLDVAYQLPPEARKFIENFDSHMPVEPFTFKMERL